MSAGRALLVEIACIATCVAVGAILAAADPLSAPTAAVGRQRVAMALGHTAAAAAAAVTAAAHAGGALLGSAAAECAAAVASRPVAFAAVAVACGAVALCVRLFGRVVRIWTLGLVVIFSYLGLSKALGALRVSEGRRDKAYSAAHLLLASRVCAQLVGAPPRLRQACPHHNPS